MARYRRSGWTTCAHSEQEKEEEKGVPIIVIKDSKTKMTTAKVVPCKGRDAYAVESVRRALEQLGHRRIMTTSQRRLR